MQSVAFIIKSQIQQAAKFLSSGGVLERLSWVWVYCIWVWLGICNGSVHHFKTALVVWVICDRLPTSWNTTFCTMFHKDRLAEPTESSNGKDYMLWIIVLANFIWTKLVMSAPSLSFILTKAVINTKGFQPLDSGSFCSIVLYVRRVFCLQMESNVSEMSECLEVGQRQSYRGEGNSIKRHGSMYVFC